MSFQCLPPTGVPTFMTDDVNLHPPCTVPPSIANDTSEKYPLFSSPTKERASKYKGVYKCGRKWKTQVSMKGQAMTK